MWYPVIMRTQRMNITKVVVPALMSLTAYCRQQTLTKQLQWNEQWVLGIAGTWGKWEWRSLEVIKVLPEKVICILKFERLDNIRQSKKWQEAEQEYWNKLSLWRIKRMWKSEKVERCLWLFSDRVSGRRKLNRKTEIDENRSFME